MLEILGFEPMVGVDISSGAWLPVALVDGLSVTSSLEVSLGSVGGALSTISGLSLYCSSLLLLSMASAERTSLSLVRVCS